MNELNHFSLILSSSDNSIEDLELKFKVNDTIIAKKWFSILCDAILTGLKIKEPERLYNFRQTEVEFENCIQKINECIIVMNAKFNNLINLKAFNGMDLIHTNLLHKYFEILRGSIKNPSSCFDNADQDLKNTIELFNIEIHRYEDLVNNHSKLDLRIVCTFKNRDRQKLANDDFSFFTLQQNFGDVFINYCEVGKTLLEVYQNDDRYISIENIRPQQHFSSDFSIYLGHSVIDQNLENKIKSDLETWLKKTDLPLNEVNHLKSLGRIPVAKLILNNYTLTQLDFIKILNRYETIKSVKIDLDKLFPIA